MKLITYPMYAAAIALAASWFIVTPILLLYGQYWSFVNILMDKDAGIFERLGKCLMWDIASFTVGLLWFATVGMFASGEES